MSDGSPLSRWAFAVLRPVVRILRAAGVTEELILAHVQRALSLHRQDPVRGRIDARAIASGGEPKMRVTHWAQVEVV